MAAAPGRTERCPSCRVTDALSFASIRHPDDIVHRVHQTCLDTWRNYAPNDNPCPIDDCDLRVVSINGVPYVSSMASSAKIPDPDDEKKEIPPVHAAQNAAAAEEP